MASEYPNTEKFVRTYARQVVSEIKNRLEGHGKIASSRLHRSIRYTYTGLTLKFLMAPYGVYVDKGRRPGKMPPLDAIRKWCRIKGIEETAAFPIARKIGEEGIRPTNFFTIPTTRRQKQFVDGVRKSLALDTEQTIKKNLIEAVRSQKGLAIKVR